MLYAKNSSEKDSDKNLILRFKETQDLEILGELYNRYTHLIYGVCLKYLKSREESQDSVIQIFELLITEIPKHEIDVFKSWLYGVTRNYCLMKLRKQKVQNKKKEQFHMDSFMENNHEMHPLDKEETVDLSDALNNCIEKLKEEQKESIKLFYLEERCYKEISEELHIEEKKVKSYIQNGKRNLKICLEANTKNV